MVTGTATETVSTAVVSDSVAVPVRKEGRGFYKLSDEIVATVHEDLANDYRELAEQHSEELAQLVDDFWESQEDFLDLLMEIRDAQQHAKPVAELEFAKQVECQPST